MDNKDKRNLFDEIKEGFDHLEKNRDEHQPHDLEDPELQTKPDPA